MSNLKMSLGKGKKKDGDPVPSTDEINMPPWYCTVVFFSGYNFIRFASY